MYVPFNPNPSGKQVGDCVIRGICKLIDRPWESVYIDICMAGLRLSDMPSSNAVWGSYLRSLGFRRYILSNTCPDCYTVRDFCLDHPEGSFLLATGEHVVAVQDGLYFDSWDSGNEVPVYYWRKEN